MKKIVSIVVAIMCLGTVNACMKKSVQPSALRNQPLTIIVMDTTQALLNGAQVKIGKKTYTTSFDGRIVLKPEQVTGNALSISCDGYESKKQALEDSPLTIITLTPKAQKKGKEDGGVRYVTLGGAKGSRLEKGEMRVMMASAPMVDAVYVEEEADAEMHILPYYGETNNAVSAGKLTAGEVNDFAKWQLWPMVMDSTHKHFISTWQIEPRQRYTVQVVNKYGYPIANYPVNLTDKRGNTVFQAITDNTGKAELWGNLVESQKSKVEGFLINGKTAESWQTIELDETECDLPQGVDVLFVFDATGSMGDELRYLQAEMKDVIGRAKAATGGLAIRTGAVVYRDHLYDEYLTRISRLTDDIATTQAFIDKQEANGGGDYPEAVPEALMAALNSAGWDDNARARIAFLILDAPCHEDSATIALLHEQILNAAAMGVRIVPVVCSGIGESGEYLLRAMALATNGTSFFLTDDSGIGHTHLKPTTDSLKVEHLNDMLVRTIVEFSYMPDCTGHWHEEQIEQLEEQFIPNPFSQQEIAQDPSIPHGPTTLYLLDVSGKLIRIYNGILSEASDSQLSRLGIQLSTGIYFVKAFYDGEWHTKKILVH